jgi:2-methylcitrate dehydratase PrpD
MCTSFAPGAAAHAGLRAAILASAGIIGPSDSIEGVNGLCWNFSGRPNLFALVDGLGSVFEIASNTYKPYPCGAVIHSAIDAGLAVAQTPGFDASAVERIQLFVDSKALALANRPQPRTPSEARVSLQHWVAVALLFGAAGVSEGSESAVRNPVVASLRAKVSVFAAEDNAPGAAEVRVLLAGGHSLRHHVEHCTGSHARPMTDGQISAKFMRLADACTDATRGRELLDVCWNLPDIDDVSALAPLLAGVPEGT